MTHPTHSWAATAVLWEARHPDWEVMTGQPVPLGPPDAAATGLPSSPAGVRPIWSARESGPMCAVPSMISAVRSPILPPKDLPRDR
jgi:hypothetical protein